MKKILTIVLAACALALAFTSCKKDKDETPSSLVGTEWGFNSELEGRRTIITIKFAAEGKYSIVSSFDDEAGTASGTYVYEMPKVTLTDENPNNDPMVGLVDGSTITIENDGIKMVFNRK